MKTIILFSVFFVLGSSALAQQKKVATVKISTPDAICIDCKKRIEDYLKYEEGVTKVVVYPTMKYTMVSFLNDRTDIEIVKTAIANCGYDADDVTADSTAYSKLPSTCKRVTDGGHKKK